MNIKIKRALISVSDKTGLIELAKTLARHNVEILSTGGTAKAIHDAGIAVKDVSAHTGFPEMMDGRVKTLHPKIHGGLLALRENSEHLAAMQQHDITPIDLVVVNLYPFENTVARTSDEEEIIENIDIGGPSMVRSAAKNHEYVAVVVSPEFYGEIIAEMDSSGGSTSVALRRRLAAAAFARTAEYDAAIASWFAKREQQEYPASMIFSGRRKQLLRYGENPHQQAAFYVSDASVAGVTSASQLQGKELSFNNIHDTDAAFELVAEFADPAVAIIKHANPCGVAAAATLAEAYTKALACDNVSAFGGIIACNRELDEATAEAIKPLFVEVIIAPKISDAAKNIFAAKPNVRLLETGKMPDSSRNSKIIKTVAGGFLIQDRDALRTTPSQWKTVTVKTPSAAEIAEMEFAFAVVKHVKSNAIVISNSRATIGIGGGQTSRVDAVRQAITQAARSVDRASLEPCPIAKSGDFAGGKAMVLASDAFFPFADNIELAAAAGIKAIIQPGGSMRDDEVIKAADAHGITMLFTGSRHFKH